MIVDSAVRLNACEFHTIMPLSGSVPYTPFGNEKLAVDSCDPENCGGEEESKPGAPHCGWVKAGGRAPPLGKCLPPPPSFPQAWATPASPAAPSVGPP